MKVVAIIFVLKQGEYFGLFKVKKNPDTQYTVATLSFIINRWICASKRQFSKELSSFGSHIHLKMCVNETNLTIIQIYGIWYFKIEVKFRPKFKVQSLKGSLICLIPALLQHKRDLTHVTEWTQRGILKSHMLQLQSYVPLSVCARMHSCLVV